MVAFLVSEVAFFSTLIVVYLSFVGRDTVGPTPREALSLPLVIVTTICLLSSSVTIHLAEGALRSGTHARFCECGRPRSPSASSSCSARATSGAS